jgi:peptidyl-prolyl cis-trans isomerase B (cyclophilin B)
MLRVNVLCSACLAVLLVSCNESGKEAPGKESKSPAKEKNMSSEQPKATPAPAAKAPASQANAPAKGGDHPRVVMDTSMGKIVVELDRARAPITVDNFLAYADAGFYNGTIFHRVIPNFMIQGGGFEPGMKQKATRDAIKNECTNGLKNKRGAIAMARTNLPHSATAQFFINTVDNAFLDHPGQTGWGYCVFGQVVEGMDTVDKIRNTPARTVGGFENVPKEDVVIRSVARQQ